MVIILLFKFPFKLISLNQVFTLFFALSALFISAFNSYGKALLPFSLKETIPSGVFLFLDPQSVNKSPIIILPINFINTVALPPNLIHQTCIINRTN